MVHPLKSWPDPPVVREAYGGLYLEPVGSHDTDPFEWTCDICGRTNDYGGSTCLGCGGSR